MLSNARIYIFNVEYQNKRWLSIQQTNQLTGLMALMFSNGIKDFTFKNIQIINVYNEKSNSFSCQIHINKISYYNNRILPKEHIAELRSKIRGQLKKILQLKFEEVLIVNDEFKLTRN